MATKPTNAVLVRASDANYTTGPVALQTTPTKIDPEVAVGGQTAEGWKVDSPLGAHPVFAQWRNFFENRNDLFVEWVKLGTNADDEDAHIVETDANGEISAVEGEFTGSTNRNFTLDVTKLGGGPPNGGSTAIRVFVDDGATGVDIDATAGLGTSVALKANNDGITQTVEFTNAGDGAALLLNSVGDVTLSAISTKQDGDHVVSVNATDTGTGGIKINVDDSPAITMLSQVTEPPSSGSSGGMWTIDNSALPNSTPDVIKCRLDNARLPFWTARTKFVWAYVENLTGTVSGAAVINLDASFATGGIPDEASDVLLLLTARLSQVIAGSTTIFGVVKFFDETNDPGVPFRTFSVREEASVLSESKEYTFRAPYTLPAAGQRLMRATFEADQGSTMGWTDALFSVQGNPG